MDGAMRGSKRGGVIKKKGRAIGFSGLRQKRTYEIEEQERNGGNGSRVREEGVWEVEGTENEKASARTKTRRSLSVNDLQPNC